MKSLLILIILIFSHVNLYSEWEAFNNGYLEIEYISACDFKDSIIIVAYPKLDRSSNYKDVYISYNMGKTWSQIYKGIQQVQITCVKILDNQIFVGTTNGIYKLDFGSETWDNTNFPCDEKIYHIEFSNNKLYAATYNSLFSTTDFGKNWVITASISFGDFKVYNNIIFGLNVEDHKMYISKDFGKNWDDLEPYYVAYGSIGMNDKYLFFCNGNFIKRSSDLGKTWEYVKNNNINLNVNALYVSGKYIIGFLGFNQIFISSDMGDTWSKTITVGKDNNSPHFPFYNESNNHIFLFTSAIYEFNKNKNVWEKLPSPFPDRTIKNLKYFNDTLVAITENNIIFSIDKGVTWERTFYTKYNLLATICNNKICRVDYFQGTPIRQVFYVSNDLGKTWDSTDVTALYDSTDIINFAALNNNIYAFFSNRTVLKTSDNGKNWKESCDIEPLFSKVLQFNLIENRKIIKGENGLFEYDSKSEKWKQIEYEFLPPILYESPTNLYKYYSDNTKLFVSKDKGRTWQQLYDFLSDTILCMNEINGKLLVGASKSLYVSTNGGVKWERPWDVVPYYEIKKILVSNEKIMFLSRDKYCVSRDYGETWLSYSYPSKLCYDIELFKKDVYMVNHEGMWRSRDFGVSWVKLYHNPAFFLEVTDDCMFINFGKEIKYSQDDASTWQTISLTENNTKAFFKNNGKIYCVQQSNVFSFDPKTFVLENLTKGIYLTNVGGVYSNNKNILLINNDNYQVFSSINDGCNWESKVNKWKNNMYTLVTFQGDSAFAIAKDTILMSIDNGNNWEFYSTFNNLFKGWYVRSFAVKDNICVLSNELGFYVSTNKGFTWKRVEEKLFYGLVPNNMQFIDDYLYATSAFGITRIKISELETSVEDNNQNFKDEIIIYPNPSNNRINFTTPNLMVYDTDIGIYNYLGEFVKSIEITNTQIQSCDISDLPNGTYFLKIGLQGKMFIKY